MDNFADFSWRNIPHLIINYPRLDIQRRASARTRLPQLIIRPKHGRKWCNFGLAVKISKPDAWHSLGHFAHHLYRHDGGTVIALPQAR